MGQLVSDSTRVSSEDETPYPVGDHQHSCAPTDKLAAYGYEQHVITRGRIYHRCLLSVVVQIVTWRRQSTRATGCCGLSKPSLQEAELQSVLHPMERTAPDVCTLQSYSDHKINTI